MSELTLEFRRAAALDTSHFPAQGTLAIGLLERLQHGRLDIVFPDGQRARYGSARSEERADLQLANWNVVGAALKSGDIGFAESYIAGDWTTSDLAQLLSFFVHNREEAEKMFYGTMIGRVAYRLRHLLNRNTKARAKKNIHAHYDLGNEFYKLWLDPTMTYSSAWLEGAAGGVHAPFSDDEFARGQQAKYQRVLDQLALPPTARVLELGCGWGGFAETAGAAGHKVTALTLSREQLAYAHARLQARHLAADVRLQDYRDENGCYDGIASIEMFEAVGEAYWPSYFAALRRCLAPGGRACVQTIVIADQLFARYRAGTDFIQQYVFPGGMLPSPSAFKAQAAGAGLKVIDEHAFGRDYARTLATWSQRFMARLDEVRALGFDDRFVRIWQFYLAYCEAAFARKNTDVVQYTLVHA
ncbi:MAG: cyclopropane-fatty-acyl-phospholipid synthase family protein [Pseudomonadota bacterium]|nr:cyclopropane-fatty-acyl-phospholipid synthase family protein [Pseudomonadota bacterium]